MALQINQDLDYQRTFWRVERAGWAAFVAFLGLAALGLLGGAGPLNRGSAAGDSIEVAYQPYVRRIAPTELRVTLEDLRGGTAAVRIDRGYMDAYRLKHVSPQPSGVRAGAEALVYRFSVPKGASEMTVTFSLEASDGSIGTLDGTIGRTGGDPATISQFVYP